MIISPLPQVPTSHHENGLPPFCFHSVLLVAEILEELIPTIKRKEISNMIESY
jgi:hypothetical protein